MMVIYKKLDRLTTRLETFMSQDFERKQKEAELLRQRLQGLNLLTSVQTTKTVESLYNVYW